MRRLGQLCMEVNELRQLLHECRERETVAEEAVEGAKMDVASLREEVIRLEDEALERSMLEQEYAKAKLELEVEKAVSQEKLEWQETERKLLEELAEARKQLSKASVVQSESVNQNNSIYSSVYYDGNIVGDHNSSASSTASTGRAGLYTTINTIPSQPLSTTCSPTDTGVVSSASGVTVCMSGRSVPPMSFSNNVNSKKMPVVRGVASSLLPDVYQYLLEVMMSIPPLGKFSGANNDSELGEQFQDWIKQSELVASVYNWDNCAKLVNLTTRLSGQAFAFYWSCSSQQRADYDALVGEMKSLKFLCTNV